MSALMECQKYRQMTPEVEREWAYYESPCGRNKGWVLWRYTHSLPHGIAAFRLKHLKPFPAPFSENRPKPERP